VRATSSSVLGGDDEELGHRARHDDKLQRGDRRPPSELRANLMAECGNRIRHIDESGAVGLALEPQRRSDNVRLQRFQLELLNRTDNRLSR
jgi:hypothetical protein